MARTIPHIHYDSIAECKADLAMPWTLPENGKRANGYANDNHGGKAWYGVGSVDTFHRTLEKGHAEGVTAIDTMLGKIKAQLPKAVGIGRKLIKGDQGDEIDIHAVNRGDISRAWSSRKRLIKRGKSAVRIVCDIAGNCNVDASTLQWRGVAAMCVAEIMTGAGYKTEIVAGMSTSGAAQGVSEVLTTVTVKSMGTQPDKGLLAAVLCLAGFFRTWGFVAIIRHADNAGKHASSGLGHSSRLDTQLPPDARFTQIIVSHDVRNLDTATKWIIATVKMLQSVKGVK